MSKYPFAQRALSFLTVHAHEDQDHIARVKEAFNRYAADGYYNLMLRTWVYTLRAYGMLFSDALERGAA
jgi:hypothetical protein